MTRASFALVLVAVACGSPARPSGSASAPTSSASAAPRRGTGDRAGARESAASNPGSGSHDAAHTAASAGKLDDVKALIASHAELNAPDERGLTPLHAAAAEGHVDVMRALLDAGADINAKSVRGVTPLYVATRMDKIEAGKLLLDRGADVNERGDGGPVIETATYRGTAMLPLLIAKARTSSSPMRKGRPHSTRQRPGTRSTRRSSCSRRKLRSKPKTKKANTPLHMTTSFADGSSRGAIDVAKLLIAAGADVHAKNADGKTPAELARAKTATELATILDKP